MPFLVPLAGAAIGAVGNAVSAGAARGSAEKQAADAAAQAAAARQQAQANAEQAINSPDAQASRQAQMQQQNFANAVLNPQLIQNQAALTGQLQQAAAGQGPNPALAQLQQTTGQNVANQAALMAGQRGAGANAGLIARQAGMQGAATQQQAVGQGATMAAQQQIAARGQLQGQLATQMGAGLQAQQGAANTALSGQGITTNALMGAAGQGTQANLGAMQVAGKAGQNAANFSNTGNAGLISGIGTAVGALATPGTGAAAPSVGGAPTASATSGDDMKSAMGYASGGPVSAAGKFLHGLFMADGGKVPALVSPGERYLPPKEVKKVASGKKSPMKAGEKIPGKPKVKGDKNSYANDTVPKTLEEGGIVLPRSVTQAKNPGKEAAKFVQAILAKQGLK